MVRTNPLADDAEWIFKSYKQLAKISFYQERYEETLKYIAFLIGMLSKLNGNYAEDSINKLLLRYMTCQNRVFVAEMYNIIINQLQDSVVAGISGHRLWLRINLDRFNNLLEDNDMSAAGILLTSIKEHLEKVSELTRNSFALEVIAAEIEYSMHIGGSLNELAQFHLRSSDVSTSITHPRVMGVIRECGATVHFYRGQFEKARLEFYESFKNYDEAGSSSKKKILKYLGLCSMLTDSEVNPFESQETQTYAQLSEYQHLIALITAYESFDLGAFYLAMETMRSSDDPLQRDRLFRIAEKRILHNLKLKVLSNYIKASKTITYDYLIQKLGLCNDEELEDLLLYMTNNGLVYDVNINYSKRFIEIGSMKSRDIFSSSTDGTTVKTNFSVLHDLGFCGPWKYHENGETQIPLEQLSASFQPSETTFRAKSNVYELLFCEIPLQQKDQTNPEEWYTYMTTSIPEKKDFSSTQRERITSTILDQADLPSQQENEEEMSNTQAGVLGLTINYHEEHEKLADASNGNKLDLLMKLANAVKRNLKG